MAAERQIERTDSARKEAERDFHNRRFGDQDDIRRPLDRWYGAVAACRRVQHQLVERYGRGRWVLEYGCADGQTSLSAENFIESMAQFHGIDLSDQAIRAARRSAEMRRLENCTFHEMDAEAMTFPDAQFDVVFGSGILHHLDLQRSFSEIARVLKPGGRAIFSEPLGHNLAFRIFRNLTPRLRTIDEHPLLVKDLNIARRHFCSIDSRNFGLTTLLAVPFQRPFAQSRLMRACERLDDVLLRLPMLRDNAWFTLIVLAK